MCGGGGGKSQTVYQQQLPGPLTDRMADAADRAVGLSQTPFQAYDGERVAGFNWAQHSATDTAARLSGYQAPNAAVTDAAARDGTAVSFDAAQINAPGGWSIEGKDLSGYTNPWESEVVRTSMSDIDRELASQRQNMAGQAAMAGAWGGSSAGLQQAALQADALRAKATTVAGLRQAGYARAQDLASADVSRGLTLAQAQAELEQQARSANAGAANQFGMANKQAWDAASMANAEARNRASLADQQASLASAGVQAAGAQSMWGIGSAAQATQQAQYDVDYDEFLREINDPFQKQQFAIGALTGVSPNFSTSSTTTRTPAPSAYNTAAGLASIGAGLAAFARGGEVGEVRPQAANDDRPGDPELAALLDGLRASPQGYWGGGAVQQRARRGPLNEDDPAVAEVLEILARRDDAEASGTYDPEAPAAGPVGGLGAADQQAVRPPLTEAEGRGDWSGGAQPRQPAQPAAAPAAPVAGLGDVRVNLSMPGSEPAEASVARDAGLPVRGTGEAARPAVAGLNMPPAAPLPMARPAAYSVPPEDGVRVSSADPVVAARYRLESGGNPRAMNQRTGAAGLNQYTPARLVDLGIYQPAEGEWMGSTRERRAEWRGRFNIPGFEGVQTIEDFLRNPEAQAVAERLNTQYEAREIQTRGLDRFVGQTIGGVEIQPADLRNLIQIAGANGAQRFLESGGRYNPSDGNMRASEFILRARGSGGSGGGGAPRQAGPVAGVPQEGAVPASAGVPAGTGSGAAAGIGDAGRDVEGASDSWLTRVGRGFRDPSSAGASLPMGLIASGLGMMASRSPYVQNAIGEGGLMGMQFLQQARGVRAQEENARAMGEYRARMARAAEQRAAREGVPPGYQPDPDNPGQMRFIPGGPADPARQPRAATRLLTPEEVAAQGYRPGTVVSVTTDARDGRVTGTQVEQQPRERPIPSGYEEDPDNPGGVRRMRGFQDLRPLAGNQVTSLAEQGTRLSTLGRLRGTFQDDYGGYGNAFTGSVANWVGRNVGMGQHEQAQWWQDYQGFINEVRNSLFGAALTATEAREFNRFSVNPGMTPRAIRQNLARQEQIARDGALRQGAALVAGRHNPEEVATALGVPVEQIEAARIRRAPEGDAVPAASGTGAVRGGPAAGAGEGGATRAEGASAAPSRPSSPAARPANDRGRDPLEGRTATNPQTGERMIRRDGRWVPLEEATPRRAAGGRV